MKIIEKYFFTLILFSILGGQLYSQQSKIDSLFFSLKIQKEDTNKVNTLNEIAIYYKYKSTDSAMKHGMLALSMSLNLNWEIGIAKSYHNIASFYYDFSNFSRSLEYYLKALSLWEKLEKDTKYHSTVSGKIKTIANIGAVYYSQEDLSQALKYFSAALELLLANDTASIKNKQYVAAIMGNMGNIYGKKNEYSNAMKYYFEALKIDESTKNNHGIAVRLGNIGSTYLYMAKEINKDSFELRKKLLNNSYDYLFKSLEIRNELGVKHLIATSLGGIGELLTELQQYDKAEKYLQQAIMICDTLNALELKMQSEQQLSDLYVLTNRYQLALEHYKKAMVLKDTLFSAEKSKEITRKEMNYEYEKKEAVTKAEHDAESKQQKLIIWSVIVGLLLMAAFAGFIFRSLRITRSQKVVIEYSKKIIEEKNKDIVDSINYAKRLQDAILPPQKFWSQHLPDSFVLYKPKDIVAGDFFYMDSVNGNVLFAAADCTGHGIPGCIVSVVCSNALNRAIREFRLTDPGKILSKVCELEEETFARSENAVRDGMDIALCRYNNQTKQLDYAGAHRPLWIIRKVNNGIEEIKGTRAAVGVSEGIQEFQQHSVQLFTGDTVYIFSDGYVDQFSPKDKKFMSKRLKDLLLSIQSMSMPEQQEHLNSFIDDWRGDMEQTDDILLIGVKI